MLKTKNSTTFTGTSIIDGKEAEGYSARIDSDNPADMTITSWQINKAVYKENREICRADRSEFEDLAYAMQDEKLAALETDETTTTDTTTTTEA